MLDIFFPGRLPHWIQNFSLVESGPADLLVPKLPTFAISLSIQ